MTNIESYLNDGANWQAQCVLAYLRYFNTEALEKTWNKEYHRYDAFIDVGRFENCREQGYICSIKYKGKQRNYAVYEHRNFDSLCVVVFDDCTINTPTLEDVCKAMGDSKYGYTNSFRFGEIVSCGSYIITDMKQFVEKLIEPES